ncbi:hypothetical protein K0M31_014075 [Melipona bicolor]|uniref:Uncharacterized protein n=1 Tax=Melipona bicolor TaxID=60889 RepID=A0AA40KTS8_9HYME|nr:hypothetical protein K0M31_014075 [Melipona bicolor]
MQYLGQHFAFVSQKNPQSTSKKQLTRTNSIILQKTSLQNCVLLSTKPSTTICRSLKKRERESLRCPRQDGKLHGSKAERSIASRDLEPRESKCGGKCCLRGRGKKVKIGPWLSVAPVVDYVDYSEFEFMVIRMRAT